MKNYVAGMYAWGGPGTVRLLEAKYHQPHIDKDSFLSLYDENRLKEAKQKFDLSDVWVTFSWGFSEETEQSDYHFISQRLPTFKKQGLRTHAYIQGLNVVTKEYEGQDIFCQDVKGRKIPYSRSRSLTCPNNPKAVAIIKHKIELACQFEFDGVFIDNMLFGFPPSFIRQDFAPAFGCYCRCCQESFRKKYHTSLPSIFTSNSQLKQYLEFRQQTMQRFVAEISSIAHHHDKYFGLNLFDPLQLNTEVYQGYDLEQVSANLDYYFIENNFLPGRGRGNAHLSPLIKKSTKPVIVISYDQGIGFESVFSQPDFEAIKTEAKQLGYKPCYKVSEFTTNHQWHTLDFSSIKPIQGNEKVQLNVQVPAAKVLPKSTLFDSMLAYLSNWLTVPLATWYFETSWAGLIGDKVFRQQLHAWKNFEI